MRVFAVVVVDIVAFPGMVSPNETLQENVILQCKWKGTE